MKYVSEDAPLETEKMMIFVLSVYGIMFYLRILDNTRKAREFTNAQLF